MPKTMIEADPYEADYMSDLECALTEPLVGDDLDPSQRIPKRERTSRFADEFDSSMRYCVGRPARPTKLRK